MDATKKKKNPERKNQVNNSESSKQKHKQQKLNLLEREKQELYLTQTQPNQFHNFGFRMLLYLIYRNKNCQSIKFKRKRDLKSWKVITLLLLVLKEEMREFVNMWVLGF